MCIDLKPAYRAIKRLRGGKKESHRDTTVTKLDGSVCSTPQENDDRWREHYQAALNHLPATFSPDLEDAVSSATPDPDIPTDAPSLVEVTRAIQRLKNGKAAGTKAAGPDGIARSC